MATSTQGSRWSVVGLTLVLLYGAVTVACAWSAVAGTDSLRGVFLIAVSAPWSLLALALLDRVTSQAPESAVIALLLLGAALNGLILYAMAAFIERRVRRRD
jgi:hypothetical protein